MAVVPRRCSASLLGRWALDGPGVAAAAGVACRFRPIVPLDGAVLLFTGGVAVVVAMLCGLAPALRSSRPDISRVLQAGFRRASGDGPPAARCPGRRRDGAVGRAGRGLRAADSEPARGAAGAARLRSRRTCSRCSSACRRASTRSPRTSRASSRARSRTCARCPASQSAALVRAVPFSGNGGTIGYAVEGQAGAGSRVSCRRRASISSRRTTSRR